jgi:hypothetical protein
MDSRVITIENSLWDIHHPNPEWIQALEGGKVLHFKELPFSVSEEENILFNSSIQNPKSRNISVGAEGVLKGAVGDEQTLQLLKHFILRYRECSSRLINSLVPNYSKYLKVSPTSFRPFNIAQRKQSWRADDRRLHVDAFATRPNYGERILRVFMNINPEGVPRVWRVGDSFDNIAYQFLPRIKPYSHLKSMALNKLGLTKSFRSEYDHMMLQIHDGMKSDLDYQKHSPQIMFNFMPGDAWVCFSDQTSHAAMSGQYMLEQTYNLPVDALYDYQSSPLAILSNKTQRKLV